MASFENLYTGCSTLTSIPVIEKDTDISAKGFFDQYIATRTPVLFNSSLTDPRWKANQWDHEYLRSKIPKEEILKIEYRSNTGETFGKGNELRLSFHDFLSKIENKEENYYLTTQELEYDEEGHPFVMTSPIAYLTDDFPLQPKLFPSLVLSNINLWYGLSSQPTTSGLHHDYHDNLYILVKGEKTVTLYSPAEAENLYTVGNVAKVHPNGRINYEGQLTFADGRDFKSEKAFQAALKLEEVSNRLKDNAIAGKGKKKPSKGDDEDDEDETEENNNQLNVQFNESDDEIDAALDAVLDAEMDSNMDEDEDDFDEEDFDDENGGEDDENEEEEDDDEESEAPITEKRKFADNGKNNKENKKAKKGPPDNFSQVNTSLPMKELKKTFPNFPAAFKKSITVTVKEGQMLYIPAGWFHEVRSKGKMGHMAVNYWFHPPDQPDFDHPYESAFWSKQWETRKKLPHRPL